MSPYITERVKRVGEYPIDGLDRRQKHSTRTSIFLAAAVQAAWTSMARA